MNSLFWYTVILMPTCGFWLYIMNKKLTPADNYYKVALRMGLILLALSSVFPFVVRFFAGDWTTSGTFGDTFGALNAVFSGITVTGLVLTILMQRKELAYQREEMTQTRHEFSVNRITNIIYNQLERYEFALEKLTILDDGKTFKGYDAIFQLDSKKQSARFSALDETPEAEQKAAIKKANCIAMTLYSANNNSIAQFALAASNAVRVIQETLLSSDISLADMNLLKNLFFRNIGFIQLHILEDIVIKHKEYLALTTEDGSTFIDECEVDTGKLSKAYIFLKSLNEFRNIEITQEYIDEVKKNWTSHFGKYA